MVDNQVPVHRNEASEKKRSFMMINPFLNAERQLRNGWWILIFSDAGFVPCANVSRRTA